MKVSDIKVFTLTNRADHPGCRRLVRSAEYWGWPLEIYYQEGWDQSWRAEEEGKRRVLTNCTQPFFLYLDAWDTLFLGPPGELLPQLEPRKLTFCGEAVRPDVPWKGQPWKCVQPTPDCFPAAPFKGFKYVNLGVVWGDTARGKATSELYLEALPKDVVNQDYVNWLYAMDQALRIKSFFVDQKAAVALNVFATIQSDIEIWPNKRLYYVPTRTMPLVYHFPANSGKYCQIPSELEELFGVEHEG